MRTYDISILVALLLISSASLVTAQPLVAFKGGIGVQPNLNVTNSGGKVVLIPNPVRGVNPDSVPWVVRTLTGKVDIQGILTLTVEGLVVAGGRGIGTSLDNSVRATLFCGPWQSATFHNSSIKTKLSVDGNLVIDEQLSPPPPNPCTAPVLLLRETFKGRWIAAGVPVAQ